MPMVVTDRNLVTLSDDFAEVVVCPSLGAAVASYDLISRNGIDRTSVLRPLKLVENANCGPFDFACNVMVPWCNRIGGDGFWFDGNYYPVSPNVVGEKYPLHGDGFSSSWEILIQTSAKVALLLDSRSIPPFIYTAMLVYELIRGALCMSLSVTNRSTMSIPFGIGFHPWFYKHSDTLLQFNAGRYWTESEDYLPLERKACVKGDSYSFQLTRDMPYRWINTAYEEWSRHATIYTSSQSLLVTLEASEALSNLMIFSPNSTSDFVCVEPMSHIPNSHRMQGLENAAALDRLEPGQSLQGSLWIRPSRTLIDMKCAYQHS